MRIRRITEMLEIFEQIKVKNNFERLNELVTGVLGAIN